MSAQELRNLHAIDGTHERAKADDTIWASLPYVGACMGLEFRNCACESTIARKVQK